MYLKKRLFFSFLFFISTIIISFGQSLIEGNLVNEKKEPQSQINILVYESESSVLIAYDVSDQNGNFSISVDSESDSLILTSSSVQFTNYTRTILNTSQKLYIELFIDIKKLKALEVKAKPIEQRGDTLNYLVASFVRQEDRSIEDILRRMPGIEIDQSGKISYQGSPIQNLYVDGLDLMDGRYSIVSKNLPQGSVNSVEVLENHQPLRVLNGKISSTQASINLKLSKGIAATGTAKIGLGYSPLLWDGNITPMFFSKKIQVLASYQTNNMGFDVSKQLTDFSLKDYVNMANRPTKKPKLINIEGINTPDIEERRYLDNNIHLANLNILVKLKDDFTLRTNVFYINDFQQQFKKINTTLYNPSDTIEFSQVVNNKIYSNYINGAITLNKNTEKYYLNNKLNFKTNWDKSIGVVLTNDNPIVQSLKSPFSALINDLMVIHDLGNHLLSIKSYISYDISPHSLEVSPGQFQEILNNGTNYNKSIQYLDLSRLFTQNSASIAFGWKKISFTPKMGFEYSNQYQISNISIINNTIANNAGDAFNNDLIAQKSKIFISTEFEYKYRKLIVKAIIPVSLNSIDLQDVLSKDGQKLNRTFFDPKLKIDYQLNGYWRAKAIASFKNILGEMDKVHYKYLLESYRVLSKNNAPISETYYSRFFGSLSFRNPINSFFNTLNYSYTIKNRNLIYSNIIDANGTSILLANYKANTSYYHTVNLRSSKYIQEIKSTIRLHLAFNHQKGQSLMNNKFFETKNVLYIMKPSLYIRIFEWLNTEYNLESQFIETFIEKKKYSSLNINRHILNIYIYPSKNQNISIKTEYYRIDNKDSFFVDVLYRYTITKKRLDFEIRWTNILNNKSYISYQTSDFSVWESTYLLRPAQLTASVKFNF